MNGILTACAVGLLAATAYVQDSAGASADETPSADEAAKSAQAAETAAPDAEFVPPPGYKRKKFGDKVLYCIKDSTVGTRFKTEKCYDETQMRDVILAREQNNRDFDRSRAVCSNPAVCRIQ